MFLEYIDLMSQLLRGYHIRYVHVMLFPMIKVFYLYSSTFRSMCAVGNVAVFVGLDFMLSRFVAQIFSVCC